MRTKNVRSKSRSRLSKEECAFCREKGHWKKDWPKLKSKAKPNNGKAAMDSNVADCADSDYSLVTIDSSKSSDEAEMTRLWHMRLGHAGGNPLKTLSDQGLLKGVKTCNLKFCEHCVKAGKTPLEKWYGKPAEDYGSLHVFGSIAYYHVRESKLDPRAKKALFMGITSGVKGYRLWCLKARKNIFSRDVTFDESTLTNKVTIEDVKQADGASKQVEFEGKIIFPTLGSNEETTEDFPLEEEPVEGEVRSQEPQPQLESIATSKPKGQ
ncbi:hypothetical protein KY290_000638 [Solanum tuberosum]|uniref:GAG-pre-integrase domain-containing protein n=1 Tax=Solanum tuberosum TaxID=4113 RepID=A0ABQ7WKG3_SOLTU|nr:hypothetical protein KY289_000705 [Solanum tuberosum]KAH0781040.1 hypothetical protein KY290_000638 [Solanum tuberosum]